MPWRPLAVLAVMLLVAPRWAVAGGGADVVLLTGDEPTAEDRAVLEAVTIYARDLGYGVSSRSGAPEAASASPSVAPVAGARLTFWYRFEPGGDVTLHVAGVDGQTIHATLSTAGLGPESAYRTLALRVRALLTAEAPGGDKPPPVAVRPPPTSAARVWARFAAGYRLVLPIDVGLLRHALFIDVALPLRPWIEVHLGTELASQPARTLPAGTATLMDVPVRLGLRLRATRGAFTVGAGAIVSLHVLQLRAYGNDRATGNSLRAAAGLGLEVASEARLSAHVSLTVRLLGEAVLPIARVLLDGVPAFDAGGLQFAFSAGLLFDAP